MVLSLVALATLQHRVSLLKVNLVECLLAHVSLKDCFLISERENIIRVLFSSLDPLAITSHPKL